MYRGGHFVGKALAEKLAMYSKYKGKNVVHCLWYTDQMILSIQYLSTNLPLSRNLQGTVLTESVSADVF